MKATVYQHVYVSGDKTMTLVILADENGSVIDRHNVTYEAYPLIDVAWSNFEHVTRIVHRCLGADIVDYHCNVLGHYHLTKRGSGYGRKLVQNRLTGKQSTKISWSNATEEEQEEESA
ncbi:hypothetical protein [Paenibacillus sp. 203]|uniref:hypothetical protein n=1 Tax=Paenibacillus sp. 203 TaxID=3096765 RepID=UPI00300A91AE